MIAYFIYEKRNDLTSTLYSFTTSRDLIDRFIEERDMDLFVIKKRDIKKKEYKLFERDHSGIELMVGKFKTKIDNGDRYVRKDIEIVCTYNEEAEPYINQEKIFKEISKTISFESRFMKKEIIEALHTLCYFYFYKYKSDIFNLSDSFVDGLDNGITGYNFELDAFGVFMLYHGYTMRKK